MRARTEPLSAGSKPASACSRIAQSSTDRAIGPQWSNEKELGITPSRETRPKVGISPETPHHEAGPRIDPPVSEPRAAGTKPAASAAPVGGSPSIVGTGMRRHSASRACIHVRLPHSVLISPLCDSMWKGCASGQVGNVLVE